MASSLAGPAGRGGAGGSDREDTPPLRRCWQDRRAALGKGDASRVAGLRRFASAPAIVSRDKAAAACPDGGAVASPAHEVQDRFEASFGALSKDYHRRVSCGGVLIPLHFRSALRDARPNPKKELGHGAQSVVLAAKNDASRAFKVFRGQGSIDRAINEAAILELLQPPGRPQHPNIVGYHGFTHIEDKRMAVVGLDRHDLNLAEFLAQADRGSMAESVAARIFIEVLCGLSYVHRRGILYRDLKAENVLLSTTTSNEISAVALCDFGAATSHSQPTTFIGTVRNMAPEFFDMPDKGIDRRVDHWALGSLLYHLLTGRHLIDGSNHLACAKQIRKRKLDRAINRVTVGHGEKRDEATRDVRALLHGLLSRDVSQRWTLDRVFLSSWVRRWSEELGFVGRRRTSTAVAPLARVRVAKTQVTRIPAAQVRRRQRLAYGLRGKRAPKAEHRPRPRQSPPPTPPAGVTAVRPRKVSDPDLRLKRIEEARRTSHKSHQRALKHLERKEEQRRLRRQRWEQSERPRRSGEGSAPRYGFERRSPGPVEHRRTQHNSQGHDSAAWHQAPATRRHRHHNGVRLPLLSARARSERTPGLISGAWQ